MRSNRGQNIRALCLLGLLTAVCFAGNYARIILPVSFGGYSAFTLGNITGVLSGLLMGPVGGVASGLGAALYDMTNPAYIMEAPLTFLNKGLMGVAAGLAACGLRGGARSWLEGRHPYPRLLLADEPTGALDTRSGEQIMELFAQLNAEGVTIVMITHELEIAQHAQRIVTIRDGRLEQGGFGERRTEQEGDAS